MIGNGLNNFFLLFFTSASIKSTNCFNSLNSLSAIEQSIWPITSYGKNLDYVLESAQLLNVSNDCVDSLRSIIYGLENHELWAYKSKFD